MKILKDLDKNHPFYSDEAIQRYKKIIKELEREEKELHRKRRNKKITPEENESFEEQVLEIVEQGSKREGKSKVRNVRRKA